jgi:molecular chaperone HtpG
MNEIHGHIIADIPNLIALLAKSLYSDPTVAIRELIQNAHDTCVERKIQHPDDHDYEPQIMVLAQDWQSKLIVLDNGKGMTLEDLEQYVAVIGATSKEFTEAIKQANRALAEQIIGKFGLGLLSAFTLADTVEIVTRAVEPGSSAWIWRCGGSDKYDIIPGNKAEPGTEVILYVKQDQKQHIREQAVHHAIKRYADFLKVPIYLNNSAEPINIGTAPWDKPNPVRKDYWDYARQHFEDMPLLTVIPVSHEADDLGFRGVLAVPKNAFYVLDEYGDINTYIKGVLVSEGEKDLLPSWAKFVRGVIDFRRGIEPTLGRERPQKTAQYFRVADLLGEQLLTYLDELSEQDRTLLREIVTNHNSVIKAWSVRDDDNRFFNRVANLVMFDSSDGWISLPQYFEKVRNAARKNPEVSENKIYYFNEKTGGVVEKTIFKEAGRPVLDGRFGAEEGFLRKYVDLNPQYELTLFDPTDVSIFHEDTDASWNMLKWLYQNELNFPIEARVGSFKPAAIPAILLPKVQSGEALIKGILAHEGLSPEIKKQFQLLSVDLQSIAQRSVLYLNTSNSLVQRMKEITEIERSDETVKQALGVVYNNALMLTQHDVLQPDTVKQIYTQNSLAVEMLIDRHLDLRNLQSTRGQELSSQLQVVEDQQRQKLSELERKLEIKVAQVEELSSQRGKIEQDLKNANVQISHLTGQTVELHPHRSCFFARPYHGDFQEVEEEVTILFRSPRVGINVISPANKPVGLEVFRAIRASIIQCHFGIADITEANPNVLVELGLMIGAGKPVIILRNNEDTTPVPFDLNPYLQLQYKWAPLGQKKYLVGIDENSIKQILGVPEIDSMISSVPAWHKE